MMYFLTGGLFYWLADKIAPLQEEPFATHPARKECEFIELYPGKADLEAA